MNILNIVFFFFISLYIYIPHSSRFCFPRSFSFSFIFPHLLVSQTPLSLLQWPTSSPTTRSPSSRRPSASSTRMAMVFLLRSFSVFFCFLSLFHFFNLPDLDSVIRCSWCMLCACLCAKLDIFR